MELCSRCPCHWHRIIGGDTQLTGSSSKAPRLLTSDPPSSPREPPKLMKTPMKQLNPIYFRTNPVCQIFSGQIAAGWSRVTRSIRPTTSHIISLKFLATSVSFVFTLTQKMFIRRIKTILNGMKTWCLQHSVCIKFLPNCRYIFVLNTEENLLKHKLIVLQKHRSCADWDPPPPTRVKSTPTSQYIYWIRLA